MVRDTGSHERVSDENYLDWTRRNVLKVTGTGAGLAVVGGVASAEGGDNDGTRSGGDDDGNTVHNVMTMIRGPPTNPNRPADFFYQPTGLAVKPGDVVKFVFVTPDHNAVSYHPRLGMRRRVPTGVDAITTPISGWTPDSVDDDQIDPPSPLAGGGENDDGDDDNGDDDNGNDDDRHGPVPETRLIGFETPGVYDLFCSPHEGFGMAMRVVVGEVTDAPFETSDPTALPEPRVGPVGLARVTLTDPALEPSNVVAEGVVPWESLEANQGSGSDGD